MNPGPPLLRMRGISKAFPGVQALSDVHLSLAAGEVLALMGENGAGKSTLMRILGGAHPADSGDIEIHGRPASISTPSHALRAGVSVIYQEFNLVPGLTAPQNVFLGKEQTRLGFVHAHAERLHAQRLFQQLGADIDLDAPVRSLSTAQQQLVEIAKALAFDTRILVMDEPTAALTVHESERLFSVIHDLRQRGLGIIYISHRLDEVFAIANRVAVLRDGRNVADRPIEQVSRPELITWMVGRELRHEFPPRRSNPRHVRLEARSLRRGNVVKDVSFSLRAGEILGISGLVGAGRTETVRLVFGADSRDSGEMLLDGKPFHPCSPRDAIRAGIGLLTEDRKLQGLVLPHSLLDNFALPNLERLSRAGFIQRRQRRAQFDSHASRLAIRHSSPDQAAGQLSGGNQQKVVLAKWLARDCDVLIFDEPTRGIDAGAKLEIYTLLQDLAASGKAILMVSSDLPELLGLADRILVMHEGRVTGEIKDPRLATQQDIMNLAVA